MRLILNIYRILLIIGAVVLFGWLTYQNIVPGGELYLTQDFCRENNFVSRLYPDNRVYSVKREGEQCWQEFFAEPVYFLVNVPRTFSQARVKVTYRNMSQSALSLGLMAKKETPLDWRFVLEPIEPANNYAEQWREKEADFSVGPQFMNEHNLEFMISAPDLTPQEKIALQRIEIRLTRPATTWRSFCQSILSFLQRKINR